LETAAWKSTLLKGSFKTAHRATAVLDCNSQFWSQMKFPAKDISKSFALFGVAANQVGFDYLAY
jgi:hypothetical protein